MEQRSFLEITRVKQLIFLYFGNVFTGSVLGHYRFLIYNLFFFFLNAFRSEIKQNTSEQTGSKVNFSLSKLHFI